MFQNGASSPVWNTKSSRQPESSWPSFRAAVRMSMAASSNSLKLPWRRWMGKERPGVKSSFGGNFSSATTVASPEAPIPTLPFPLYGLKLLVKSARHFWRLWPTEASAGRCGKRKLSAVMRRAFLIRFYGGSFDQHGGKRLGGQCKKQGNNNILQQFDVKKVDILHLSPDLLFLSDWWIFPFREFPRKSWMQGFPL